MIRFRSLGRRFALRVRQVKLRAEIAWLRLRMKRHGLAIRVLEFLERRWDRQIMVSESREWVSNDD